VFLNRILKTSLFRKLKLISSFFLVLSHILRNIDSLQRLWVSVLKDYAKFKIDVDLLASMRLSPKDSENSNAEMYVEATREVLKPVSYPYCIIFRLKKNML
jgi:hypothetical protein